MSTEYITARSPGAQDVKTQTLKGVRDRVHKFIRPGERARVREIGEDYGHWRKEADVVPQIRRPS